VPPNNPSNPLVRYHLKRRTLFSNKRGEHSARDKEEKIDCGGRTLDRPNVSISMEAFRTLKMYPAANIKEQATRNGWGGRQRCGVVVCLSYDG